MQDISIGITHMTSFKSDPDVYSSNHSKTDETARALHTYQMLIENVSDIFFVISAPDNQFTYINKAIEEILGYSPREAITLRPTSLVSEASGVTLADTIRRTIAQNSNRDHSIYVPEQRLQVLSKNGFFETLRIHMILTVADDHSIEKITGIAKTVARGPGIFPAEKTTLSTDAAKSSSEYDKQQYSSMESTESQRTTLGSILIMDDEDIILDISTQMCKRIGLEVAVANNGDEAVDMYRERFHRGESFDAVFLDMTIAGSGLGGIETAEKLKEIDPEVRCVVMSGYSDHEVMSDPEKFGFYAVLVKPFRLNDFSSLLKELIPDKLN